MASFLENTAERERSSSSTVRGDVVPVFNPEDRIQTVSTWCQKVDELREIYKWSEEATTYFAMSKLRGLANVWYRSLPSLKFTWGESKEKLESAFPPKQDYYADLQEMIARRKRQEETYAKYYYEKIAMLNRCKIFGEDAVSCIIGGIHDTIVKTGATAGNHKSPESLYGYLSSLNNTASTSKIGSDHFQLRFKNKNRRHFQKHKVNEMSGKGVTCYRCKQVGHTANFCKEKITEKNKLNCNFCHRAGHLEENCFTKRNKIKPII